MALTFTRVVLAFTVGALLVPLFAHGQTISEMQQQVADLLARLTALQTQIAQVAGTNSTYTPTTVYGTGTGNAGSSVLNGGLSLSRDIARGSTGADVSSLQSFLGRDPSIYPENQITGTFGPLTEAAVRRFQVACGIVSAGDYGSTGYGRVGPRTRAALQHGCASLPPTGVVGALLRVAPASGPGPLTTTISVTLNTSRSCSYSQYTLDFGDGSTRATFTVPGGSCAELTQSVPHTYTVAGEYTVRVSSGPHYATTRVTVTSTGTVNTGTGTNTGTNSEYSLCTLVTGSIIMNTSPRQCQLPDGRRFTEGVNTGTYTGTGTQTGNALAVTPSQGAAPLSVNAQFSMRPGDPYEIDWGDGTLLTRIGTFSERGTLPAGSTVFSQGMQLVTVPHQYTTQGNKAVTLKIAQYELDGANYVWRTRFYSQQVTVSGTGGTGTQTGNDRITVSPASGSTPLDVSFDVRINGMNLCGGGTYTLDFGDGQRVELTYSANNCTYRDAIVTHRYTTTGSFTAKLYAFPPTQISTITQPVATATVTTNGATTATTTDPQLTVTPGYGGVLRQVQVSFRLADICTPFTLSWGDNSTSESRTQGTSGCNAGFDQKTYTHTFPTVAGSVSYTITLTYDPSGSQQTRTATIVIVGS